MMKPFFVREKGVLIKIIPDDVVFLITEENYTKIFLSNDSFFMVRATMSNALKKLPPDVFVRVSRSFAVSVYYIDKIFKDYLSVGKDSFAIPKRSYKSFIEQLNIIK